MLQKQLKEFYYEILELLPSDVREFFLKRGKDILIIFLVVGVIYVLTFSFIKYQEKIQLAAAKELGFAIAENDMKKKEKMFKDIINGYSNTSSANFSRLILGSLMLETGKKDDARNSFQEAQKKLSATPALKASARIGEAYSIIDTKQDEALSILKEISESENNPYTGVALISMAVIYENKEDFKQAKTYYDKYNRLFPNDPNSSMIKEKLQRMVDLSGGNNTSS
jgi:predicted negative regulator of RcsB-dependent stress response